MENKNIFEEAFKKQKGFYDSLPKEKDDNEIEEENTENKNSVSEKQKSEKIQNEAKEISLPDLNYLDDILEESEKIVKLAMLSEQEINEMLEKRQETRDEIRELEIDKENRLQQAELFNPVENLTIADYKRMVVEGIIDESYAKRLEKLDDIINTFSVLDNISTENALKLRKLSQIRSSIRKKLESQIQERQQEFIEYQKEIKDQIFQDYAEKVEKLENIMLEIESNPKAFNKLYDVAKKEMEASERKKEEIEKKVILEATRITQSLTARHSNVFKRLEEIVHFNSGDEEKNIKENLVEVLKRGNKKEIQSVFDKVRSQIIKSIVEGEGEEQIKSSKELVPWEIYATAIPYIDAINDISALSFKKPLQELANKDNEKAEELLKQCSQIFDENLALRKLVGKKWIRDKKTGK